MSSAMSRTHADAKSFVARGIDVLSVPEFIRGFVGQPVTALLHSHPGKCLHVGSKGEALATASPVLVTMGCSQTCCKQSCRHSAICFLDVFLVTSDAVAVLTESWING